MTRSDDDHACTPTRSPVAPSRPRSIEACLRFSTVSTTSPLTDADEALAGHVEAHGERPYIEAGSAPATRAIGFHSSRSACHCRTR